MKKYIEWLVSKRKTVILVVSLITLGLIAQLRNVTIIIDPDATLPQSHPFVAATHRIEKLFGNKNSVVIGVTARSGDAFQPGILAKVKTITDRVSKAPGVMRNNVISIASPKAKNIIGTEAGLEVKPLMASVPQTNAEITELRQALLSNPVYSNLIVSKDQKTLSIIAEFDNSKGGYRAIDEQIRQIVASERDHSAEISIGGGPAFLSVIERFSARMGILFPLAVLLIGLIHYEAFRTLQALVFPLVTALLAVIWGLGFMALSGVALDVFNVTTPILILAIAAGHAVQMLKRYYEEYHRIREARPDLSPQEANRQAVIDSVSRIGAVMIAAGVIAALGFFSLVVFEIKTIRAFGVFTGLGILSALILEMTFIPALRSLLPPPGDREARREKEETFWDRLVNLAYRGAVHHRGKIYTVAAILTIALGFGALLVRTDDSTKATLSAKLEVRQDDEKLNQRLGGSNTLYVLIEGKQPGAIQDPKVLRGMQAIQDFLGQEREIGKTVSLVDFIRRMNLSMNGDKPEFDRIPEGPTARELIAQYLLLYSTSGEPGDFDSYVDYDYQNASILGLVKTDSSAYVADLASRLRQFASAQFGPEVSVQIGGGVMVGAALTEVLVRDKILNIVQIAFVVFVISSLLFRSILAGALIMVPLLMTVLANFGVMGLTGIPLQMATALTSAMAVGIGADYAIYLTYRLREELRQSANEEEAIRRSFASAGKAVLFVSSAVAGGYALLILSWGFLVHIWMGILISLAMIVASISALTIFPSLLLSLRPRFVFGPGTAPVAKPRAAVVTSFLLALCVSAPDSIRAAELTAAQIMEKSDAVSRVVDSSSDSTFTLINASGQKRVRKTRGMTKLIDGTDLSRRFIRFVSPPDVKGTATLLIERKDAGDDIWIYLPALKKTRRLVSSNKKESFVGTDFSYADVIGHRVEDWNHSIVKEETIDGQRCYVIESTPKNDTVRDESGYSRRITWVEAKRFVAIRGEAYDLQTQLLKKFSSSDFRPIDETNSKWQPMRIEGQNVKTGHRTVIEFENFKADQGLKDELFTTRQLERES